MAIMTFGRSQPPSQQSGSSNDDPIWPSATMSLGKRDNYYFQTQSQSPDTGSTSEGLVQLPRNPNGVSARLAQESGSGTSQGERRQPGNFSTKQSTDYDEVRENSSNSAVSGHGLRELPSTSGGVSRAIDVYDDRQTAANIIGDTPARDEVGRSQAGGAKQKKLEKQVLTPTSTWWKSLLSVYSACFLLLFLADLAAGIDCGVSTERVLVPSVVEDTAGALQLAEAMHCVDGGSFAVEWIGFVTLATPIVVNGTMALIVTGSEDGSSWVNGASQQPLFKVSSGGALSLSGLNLIRGNNKFGGAIYAHSSIISVANCLFNENNAGFGGAVYASSSNISVANCSFNENSATIAENNETYGGAIHAYTSNVSVANCSFIGNNATSGGAIYLALTALVLSNANFFGNIAYSNRGYGGAIYVYVSDFSVANSLFVENNASFGGSIIVNAGNLTLSDTNFSNNFANSSGGAIYGQNDATIVVKESVVWETNSAILGGAIRLHTSCSLRILGSARIAQNVAKQGGGFWLSDDTTMATIGSAIFHGNTAKYGGGMYVFDSFAYFLPKSTVRFSDNIAEAGGATMQYISGLISIEGQAIFTNNTAQTGGAMMMQEGVAANISGEVTMSNNTASSSGGAVHCEATTSLEIHNTRFVSNHAGSSGGAITALSSGTRDKESIISLGIFEDNFADDAGGAIFIAGGFIDIKHSTFTRNTAGRSGGAVITSGFTSVAYCIFTKNRAYTGPAVSNTVSVYISWTEFADNALLCGDGYFLDFSTNVSAYETACYECHAEVECEHCIVQNRDEVQVCEPVLAHTASPSGNGTLQSLELHKGFWRISSTSKDVRECYEADACIGGTESYCSAGYTGPYCTVCVDGYARGFGRLCSKCSDERRSVVIALATVFIVALFAAIVVRIRSRGPATEAETFPHRRVLEMAKCRFRGTRMYQALKIVVVSWQIVIQFSEVANVTYPDEYELFLGYIDVINLNLGWMLSAGCLVSTNFYADLLVSTIGPLIIVVIALASYRVNSLRCPVDDDQERSRLRNSYGAFLFGLSFLLYSTVSSSIFQTFGCDKLDDGKSYLRSDYSLECYTVEHKIIMSYASVMAILYPFGIPFCYGLVLYRNRTSLKMTMNRETSSDLAAFKDLWRPYRPEVAFYEVIECLRRVVLSGIVVFVFPNTAGQVAMTFLFALVFFAVLMALNPYTNQWDTWLARFGHAIVIMSMFVALLQKVDTSDDDMFSRNVFGGVLVAGNCVVILTVGAESCGLCFFTVREVDQPVHHQGVMALSVEDISPANVSSQGIDVIGKRSVQVGQV